MEKKIIKFVIINLLAIWALGRMHTILVYPWDLAVVATLAAVDFIVLRRARSHGERLSERSRQFVLRHIFLITLILAFLLTAFNSLVTIIIGQRKGVDVSQVLIGGTLGSYFSYLLKRAWSKEMRESQG